MKYYFVNIMSGMFITHTLRNIEVCFKEYCGDIYLELYPSSDGCLNEILETLRQLRGSGCEIEYLEDSVFGDLIFLLCDEGDGDLYLEVEREGYEFSHDSLYGIYGDQPFKAKYLKLDICIHQKHVEIYVNNIY